MAKESMALRNDVFYQQLQQAANLNFDGVASLYQPGPSNARHAVTTFEISLRLLQAVAQEGLLEDLPPRDPFIYTESLLTKLRDDDFFICSQPRLFRFATHEAVSLGDLSSFTAVALFNVALTYHRRGLERGQVRYYKMAHRLYMNSAECLRGQLLAYCVNLKILYLASVNNMAHIEYRLNELENSRITLEQRVRPALEDVLQSHLNLAESEISCLINISLNVMFSIPVVAGAA